MADSRVKLDREKLLLRVRQRRKTKGNRHEDIEQLITSYEERKCFNDGTLPARNTATEAKSYWHSTLLLMSPVPRFPNVRANLKVRMQPLCFLEHFLRLASSVSDICFLAFPNSFVTWETFYGNMFLETCFLVFPGI